MTPDKELVIKSKARKGVFYVINKIAGQRGRFYYIQQKEMDEYRTLNVKGGILVSEEDAREFITQLHSYCAGQDLLPHQDHHQEEHLHRGQRKHTSAT